MVNFTCKWIVGTCLSGIFIFNIYVLHTETVKDLIKFLRREDDTCEIRRQLGNAKILQNDLIYVISQHSKDTELFETCIRYVCMYVRMYYFWE